MSTFLRAFDGLWRRPADDYKNAVRDYRIAVDTNVLLELYRFTPEAREELINVLRQLKERLWIPHQVAAEYYNRRVDAVKEHIALYDSVPVKLEEQKNKALQELQSFANRCSMDPQAKKKLTAPIEHAFMTVNKYIKEHRGDFDLTLERVVDADPVLAALSEIFDGRTGTSYDDEKQGELLIEFQRRVAEKIPPGYKDANKADNSHGDFFVWEQLIEECATSSTPLLFVTNDAKEDWVRREAGLIVGARPELVVEFRERCNSDFLITQLGKFLQIAKEVLNASVSASTVAQAENITSRNPPPFRERIILPKAAYHELINVLHAASTMDVESLDGLTVEQMRGIKRTRAAAARIEDMISSSAAALKGDVRFQLDSKDWRIAHDLWEAARGPGALDSNVIQTQFTPRDIKADWVRLAQLERKLENLRLEKAQLSARDDEMEAAELAQRADVLQEMIASLERDLAEVSNRMHSGRGGEAQ